MKKNTKSRSPEEVSRRRRKMTFILYSIVMLSFIIPIVFLIVMLCTGGIGEGGNDLGQHSRSDYTLMLAQCVLGVIVMHIPSILAKKFRFEIPRTLFILYIIFLYCAIFLGEVRSFYYLVPNWDTILHAMSSVMTGFFGLMVVYILNRDEHLVIRLSPFFISLFAFSFAVTVGAVWEIYEFTADGMLGMNMQRFHTATGELLIGRDALSDTMKDIIVDTLGALAASIIGYFSIKFEKGWFVPELSPEKSLKAE